MSTTGAERVWRPDGAGSRARIGVLTPHLDPVPESECQALAPEGVSVHAARVPLGMVGPDGEIVPHIGPDAARAFSEPPEVDNAVASLAPLGLGAIIYAFTSSSYILGSEADAALAARLTKRAGGIPVVLQTAAIVTALRSLSAVAGAITVPVVYWIGVNVGGEHDRRFVGIIAALVVTLSPVLIEYGQEARPYAALVLAYALALAGLFHPIRFPDDACRPWLGVAAHLNEPNRPP